MNLLAEKKPVVWKQALALKISAVWKQTAVWKKPVVILFLALSLFLFLYLQGATAGSLTLKFLGAAREVGGSCHLVNTGKTVFLVDCGAFGKAGKKGLPADPASISFVLLTHAHSDHCGLLPELFDSGFGGKVYCTRATAEIVPIMLRMSRSFSREKASKASFDRSIEQLTVVPYDGITVAGDVSFRFRRAGHLLGAAFIEIWVSGDSGSTKLVFSGDIGSGSSLLLPPIEVCSTADYVIMESTYGCTVRKNRNDKAVNGNDRGWSDDDEAKSHDDYDSISIDTGSISKNHDSISCIRDEDRDMSRHDEFANAVAAALRTGGDVLIPAFTLGRTQEVMATLDLYSAKGVIPAGTEIYTDSPTAKKISDIYRNSVDDLSSWARSFYAGRILYSNSLREVKSRTSMKVHSRKHKPTIFISSSGDLNHANSPRHLMQMFDDQDNLLCVVGWQSPGSTGRRLVEGQDPVLVRHSVGRKVKRDWISPAMKILRVTSFSGHADQDGLVDWLAGISGVKKVFLVHGDLEKAQCLADRIKGELGVDVKIPRRGESIVLTSGNGSGSVEKDQREESEGRDRDLGHSWNRGGK